MESDSFIAGAVGTIIGALVWAFKEWWKQRLESQKIQNSQQAYIDSAEVYQVMNEAMSSLGISRMLVLFSENGGGIPGASRPIHVSILYEAIHQHGLQPIREDYQCRLIDQQYTKMLRDVIENGEWICHVNDMEEGFLKSLYLSEGMEFSHVLALTTTPKKFFFLSCRWASQEDHDQISLSTLNEVMKTTQHKISRIVMRSEEK